MELSKFDAIAKLVPISWVIIPKYLFDNCIKNV
jgi:hypothetical protein